MLTPGYLETSDALAFANIKPKSYDNATTRGHLPYAPKTVQGQTRRFDVDDLTAAYVLGFLFDCGVVQAFACDIAGQVLALVRKRPDLETVAAWKCTKAGGEPYVVVTATEPRTRAIRLFEFPVGKIRRLALEGIAAKAREPSR